MTALSVGNATNPLTKLCKAIRRSMQNRAALEIAAALRLGLLESVTIAPVIKETSPRLAFPRMLMFKHRKGVFLATDGMFSTEAIGSARLQRTFCRLAHRESGEAVECAFFLRRHYKRLDLVLDQAALKNGFIRLSAA